MGDLSGFFVAQTKGEGKMFLLMMELPEEEGTVWMVEGGNHQVQFGELDELLRREYELPILFMSAKAALKAAKTAALYASVLGEFPILAFRIEEVAPNQKGGFVVSGGLRIISDDEFPVVNENEMNWAPVQIG